MQTRKRVLGWVLCAAGVLMLTQAGTAQKRGAEQTPAAAAGAPDEVQAAEIQRQLLQLLRTSPTLTSVVARDPSLLADQAYVTRNNPELEQFLAAHPDVARNPEFYLFSHLNGRRGPRDQALERTVWPEMGPPEPFHNNVIQIVGPIAALLAFACFLAALVWLIRMLVETRRWNRAFKLQSDVHSRLIDKFSSNQELAAYMQTDAGRRFLEAAPIPMGAATGQRMPSAVARVLTPVQVGVVMVLLGIGLLLLRNAGPDMGVPMLVLGTVILMPGIGFILSAAAAWGLARRLGLMPRAATGHEGRSDSQDSL